MAALIFAFLCFSVVFNFCKNVGLLFGNNYFVS